MMLSDHNPIDYLALANGLPWHWEADAIILANGTTLAFREEVITLINAIHPSPLPPLETLLLFLAASRDQWKIQGVREFLQKQLDRLIPGTSPHCLEYLDKIHALPEGWRRGGRERSLLASVIFESDVSPSDESTTPEILRLLRSGFIPPHSSDFSSFKGAVERLSTAVESLKQATQDLSPERLQLRMRTGLDALFKSDSEIGLPFSKQIRTLLLELEGDPQHQGLARLTKALMAAIHVPRPLADVEDLPMGGYSDLTNRGTPDRLIVSELAQDDLIFSLRMALNHALYLRRETPPHTPKYSRILLIDNGLPLWGTIRIFATAVALAIAATADAHTNVRVFSTRENGEIQAVQLETREGLLHFLEGLQLHAHPGNHLLRLMDAPFLTDANSPEVFLITHSQVLKDPNFLSLAALSRHPFYLATVDRGGHFLLHSIHQNQNKILQRTPLQIQDLITPDPTPSVVATNVPQNLPAAFYRQPFPLLFPMQSDQPHNFHFPSIGIVQVTKDQRLLLFTSKDRGGVQFHDAIPKGRLFYVAPEARSTSTCGRLLKRYGDRVSIVEVDSGLQQVRFIPIKHSCPRNRVHAVMSYELLLLIYPKRIDAIDPETGACISTTTTAQRIGGGNGQFIHQGATWHRISFDGARPVIEETPSPVPQTTVQSDKLREPSWEVLLWTNIMGFGIVNEQIVIQMNEFAPQGQNLTFFLLENEKGLALRPATKSYKPLLMSQISGPERSRYRLNAVNWDDGSRAVIDSRGLLHLKSSRAEIPELTLILPRDRSISAWSDHDETFGDPFFLPSRPNTPIETLWEYLSKFVRALPPHRSS